MTIFFVTYQGDATTPFDRSYYVNTHLPLCIKSWKKYGLEKIAAYFPDGDGDGTIAICQITFRDQTAMETCFASPETADVMADVPNYTTAHPSRFLASAF